MWKRAFKDTRSYFGWNKKTIIPPLVAWGMGILIYWQWQGWDAMKEEVAVAIAFIVSPIALYLFFVYIINLIRAPVLIKWEKEKEPTITVSPYSGRKQNDWERTEHFMWAELRVTNTSLSQELKNVEVHVVSCLAVLGKQDSPNEYHLYRQFDWNPTAVYWSTRNTIPQQMKLSIPPSATRISLIAFQDNSNGGQFVFNGTLHEWIVGGVKIEVEISSPNATLLKRAFYIECHPNYAGRTIAEYKSARFEFIEWDIWVASRSVTLLEFDKEGSQTE